MSALYFPQLSKGVISQYPVTRKWSRRVSSNVLADGSTFVLETPAPPQLTWRLQYRGLSTDEWESIETLFKTTQGRYESFTFVDPTDNLLKWSSDLTSASWTSNPLLTVNSGASDPFGGSVAASLINVGQSVQSISQTVPAAGWFQYSFSLYLRAGAACQATLFQSSGGSELRRTTAVTQNWTRASLSGALAAQNDGIQFGIELPPGVTVVAYGPQAEAQPCAGPYKPTLDQGGVYTNARFNQDALTQNADELGFISTTLEIIANG